MPKPGTLEAAGWPLALTMGDPAGIGLDITLAAWTQRREASIAPFVFYGDPDALSERAAQLGLACPVQKVSAPSEATPAFADRLPVMPIPLRVRAHPGRA